MASDSGRTDRRVKRRIAATAATAALALSGPAAAARPAAARSPVPARPDGDGIARLATSDRTGAALALDATRRSEMASHRRRLAAALAAELDDRDAASLEHAIAAAETEVSAAYARGERPRFVAGIPTALTDAIGIGTEELGVAFESMSRRALERRRAGRA